MNVCDDCALRLFNTKHYNLKGVGNPYFGNCILIPNVDYSAYKENSLDFSKQVEVIKEVLNLPTGELENLYIAPLVRCCESISCPTNNDAYVRCLNYFGEDVKKYNFKHILLLGQTGSIFLNVCIRDYLDTLMVSKNGRFYNVNYSPLTKYTNEKLFEQFKQYLTKWYNYITSGMSCYDNYVILE